MAAQAVRRKSTSTTKKFSSGTLPLRQNVKSRCPSNVLAPMPPTNESCEPHVHLESRHAMSREYSDYGTLFNDPRKVRQWAVSSANGSTSFMDGKPIDLTGQPATNAAYDDVSTVGFDPGFPSDLHSAAFQFSMLGHPGIPDGPIPHATSSDMYDARSGNAMAFSSGATYNSELAFMDNNISDENPLYASWPAIDELNQLGTPTSMDTTNTTSPESCQHLKSDYYEEFQSSSSYWTPTQFHVQGPIDCPSAYRSNDAEWSPSAGTMDPSVSSSYSQGSYMHPHAESPISYTAFEDPGSVAPHDDYGHCGLPADGSSFQYPSSAFDNSLDTSSTLRPARGFQRTSLSPSTFWPQYDQVPYQVMGRRLSGEGEKSTARCDELYQVQRQDDGLYHCPFEVKEGCTHKPENLKCNYDKHLDSHLKPYRCKVRQCETVPFSSTACLLRHEREAHGMHGHGEKPYLCKYEVCDRSTAGNGFPRRWNLRDHMKRVHEYTGPSSTGSASPSPSSVSSTAPSKLTSNGRKKRTSKNSDEMVTKRPKSLTGTKSSSKATKGHSSTADRRQQPTMQKQWREQHAALKERLDSLDPADVYGHEKVSSEFSILRDIGRNLHWPEAEQFFTME